MRRKQEPDDRPMAVQVMRSTGQLRWSSERRCPCASNSNNLRKRRYAKVCMMRTAIGNPAAWIALLSTGGAFAACNGSSPDLAADCIALCQAEQANHCACVTSGACATQGCPAYFIEAEKDTGCAELFHAEEVCLLGNGGPGVCGSFVSCTDAEYAVAQCVDAYCANHPTNALCAEPASTGTCCAIGSTGSGGASGSGGSSGGSGGLSDGGPT
jgi:uncharacterized membrane protein YgcG